MRTNAQPKRTRHHGTARRFTSWILSCLLMFSTIPAASLAVAAEGEGLVPQGEEELLNQGEDLELVAQAPVTVDTWAALVAAIESDGTVQLQNDITFDSDAALMPLTITNNVTIDLNGKTLTGSDGFAYFFEVPAQKSLTLTGNGTLSKGGVHVNGGTFTMTGGTITGNTIANDETALGGGVYVEDGTFNVSGKPIISGNTVNTAKNNVYLASGKLITVTGSLDDAADINVSTPSTPSKSTPVPITNGYYDKNATLEPRDVFSSDNSSYEIAWGNGSEAVIASDTYKITFNKNGGKGDMDAQYIAKGQKAKLRENEFKYSGYKFDEWDTKSGGGGDSYDDKESIKPEENTELYAQWEEKGSGGGSTTDTYKDTWTWDSSVYPPTVSMVLTKGDSTIKTYATGEIVPTFVSTTATRVTAGKDTFMAAVEYDGKTFQSSTEIDVPARSLEVGQGAPATALNEQNLTQVEGAVLTDQERTDGKYLKLFVTELPAASVSQSDADAIKSTLANTSVADYFDLSLRRINADGTYTDPTDKIATLATPIWFSVVVPESQRKPASGYTRTFHLIRLHEGQTAVIASTTDTTIPATSDRFSTYAIVYEDTKTSSSSSDNKSTTGTTTSSSKTTTTSSKSSTPATGDSTSSMPIVVLCVAGVGAVCAAVYLRRRNDQ